jgi:hypothetical protein
LLLIEIRKFSNNPLGAVSFSKIAEYEAYRNPGTLDSRFPPKHIRGAFYMILPCYMHFQPHYW